jgi:hypothetical protein
MPTFTIDDDTKILVDFAPAPTRGGEVSEPRFPLLPPTIPNNRRKPLPVR